MCSIRVLAKNHGDPYYEPTIVVHDSKYVLNCKITNFSSHLFAHFFGSNYNIGQLTSATSNERTTTNTAL